MFKIHEIFGCSVNEVEGKTRFSVKHIFVPWRYLDDCYKILIFGPQNKLTHHPSPRPPTMLSTATFCGGSLDWKDPTTERKENIFWERATVPALLPPSSHSPEGRKNWMTMSAGALVCGWGRGQEAEPQGCLFPAEVLSAVGVLGGTAELCCRGGTLWLCTSVSAPCLQVALPYTTCATLPAWHKESVTSLQGFPISSPLHFRNWYLRVLPSVLNFAYRAWEGL